MVILETERLLLRKPTIDDASFMLRLVNDPSWLKYIGDRKVYTIEQAEQYLLNGTINSFQTNGFGFGIVIQKESGIPIGMCGLVKRDFLDDIDLGFAFFPEYTAKGYAFEVAQATLQHASEVHKINRLVAITTKDNDPSIRLLEKLGFLFEKDIVRDEEELFLFGKQLR